MKTTAVLISLVIVAVAIGCSAKRTAGISEPKIEEVESKPESSINQYIGDWYELDDYGIMSNDKKLVIDQRNGKYNITIFYAGVWLEAVMEIDQDGFLNGYLNNIGQIRIGVINDVDQRYNGGLGVIMTDTPEIIEIGDYQRKK